MSLREPRWNLNIHYHRILLEAMPPDARTALDIGCGDGLLSFDLADQGLDVVGIDLHAASIERARADPRATHHTEFVCGDVFTHPFDPASFDLVAASAMLHHVDARKGLRRMRQLVRPGGVIAVVGFAQPDGMRDRALALAGAAVKRAGQVRRRYWEHNAPIAWPPPLTTGQMQELGCDELPGATFRHLMSNRFSLVWTAPHKDNDSKSS